LKIPLTFCVQCSQAFAPTILFEAYDNAAPFGFLDKLICQWRLAEDATRAECGMPSITTAYPGCLSNQRGLNNTLSSARRDVENGSPERLEHENENRGLRSQSTGSRKDSRTPKERRKSFSALDVVLGNSASEHGEDTGRWKLEMDPSNFRPEMSDNEWDAFIQSQYEQEQVQEGHRHLTNYDNVGPWHNYFLMIGVKTEVR
jgi:hypothetical protein